MTPARKRARGGFQHLPGILLLAACSSTTGENTHDGRIGTGGNAPFQATGGGGAGAVQTGAGGATGSVGGSAASSGGAASMSTPGAGGVTGGQAGAPPSASGGNGGAAGTGVSGPGGSAGATGAGGSSMGGADAGIPPMPGDCSSLPPATDYGAKGPFGDAKMIPNTGPMNAYTLFRPDASLGKDGFKHPIATWGNGITTTPSQYTQMLTTIASHGFVVIASNNTTAERPALSDGLDWLIQQNMSGDMAGKLDVEKELAIGYSWGGGAAIDVSDRPNIQATVSFHGMPPRQTNAFMAEHSPLLLFTSTGDTFVTASQYVTPNYQKATVQTFYATLEDSTFSHTSIISKQAGPELGPAIAWLRFWACHDENARKFFYGDDCGLCKSPFTMPQRKNWK